MATYREMITAMERHFATASVHVGGRPNRALEASLRRRNRALRARLAYWERRLPKERTDHPA
ncbi:MAG TPA: hypothetical protein VF160_08070 [Candidatus Dormibacteraeota bacterium]